MANDRNYPSLSEDASPSYGKDAETNDQEERFESDTQRIVHRHLQNKDDVITDEDIASVRVGMSPPVFDEATEAGVREYEDEIALPQQQDGNETGNAEQNNGKQQPTSWDTIEPAS